MLLIAIIALIIAIIVLTVKYIRINARVLGRESFEKAADKRVRELRISDPVISCDYCGAKIDTRVSKVCPSCGAAYDVDREWKNRYNNGASGMDRYAERLTKAKLKEADLAAAKTARRLKKAITILGVILGLFIILCIVVSVLDSGHDYVTEDEKLNVYSFDDFEKVDYDVEGSGVIFSEGGVRITVEGIYRDADDNDYKIACRIENNSGGPAAVGFSLMGVNDRVSEGREYLLYDWFKDGASVLLYAGARNVEDSAIKTMTFGDFSVFSDEETTQTVRKPGPVILNTTASFTPELKLPEGEVIYEAGGVMLIKGEQNENGIVLWIMNGTENNYVIEGVSGMLNGKPAEVYGPYKGMIPAGNLYKSYPISSVDSDYRKNLSAGDEFMISVNLTCSEKPEAGFTTEFIRLQ